MHLFKLAIPFSMLVILLGFLPKMYLKQFRLFFPDFFMTDQVLSKSTSCFISLLMVSHISSGSSGDLSITSLNGLARLFIVRSPEISMFLDKRYVVINPVPNFPVVFGVLPSTIFQQTSSICLAVKPSLYSLVLILSFKELYLMI